MKNKKEIKLIDFDKEAIVVDLKNVERTWKLLKKAGKTKLSLKEFCELYR